MGSRIVSLRASNVKRLVAVEITPGDDGCVLIGGRNGAGKSSVLDSIMFALGGAGVIQEQPLRRGQKSGSVRLDLGDLIVERKFTEKGSTVKVSTADGANYASPQKVLDALFCRLSFDPLAFAQMKPADQSATLRELMGIDTAEIDKERAELYSERTIANRRVKDAEANLNRVPAVPKLEGKRPNVDAIVTEIGAALEAKARLQTAKAEWDEASRRMTRASDSLVATEKALADLDEEIPAKDTELAEMNAAERIAMIERHRRELDALDELHSQRREQMQTQNRKRSEKLLAEQADLTAAYESAAAELASMSEVQSGAVPDVEGLQKQLSEAKSQSALWDQQERRLALAAEVAAAQKNADDLTTRIELCDDRKRSLLAAAKYPIDGLSVGEDGGVLFEGIPFAQASRAQQIRTSVAMGLAMNPQLRVLLIRDGSLLDDDGLALVAEMARERDAQIWVERVGNRDESAIIIEDGQVLAETEPVENGTLFAGQSA